MDDNIGPTSALRSWIYNKSRKQGVLLQNNKTNLTITLTNSLQFETDNINEWMLEAKLEPKK